MSERRRQSNIESQKIAKHKVVQGKSKKKDTKASMIICLILGIVIGWVTEFDIRGFIENISQYKIAIIKKNNEQGSINSESSSNKDGVGKFQESYTEDATSNEVVKGKISNTERQFQQENKKSSKENKQDKINKAKKAIIKNCGTEWGEVVYATESAHPTKGGNYYIFNVGPDGMGDMQFYVDTKTYKVYEYSVDGYFGKYRNDNSDIFTYDMAIMKLKNDLGWDEDRIFILVEEKSDGFIIRTVFKTEGGSGTGETFYVTKDDIDVYTGY